MAGCMGPNLTLPIPPLDVVPLPLSVGTFKVLLLLTFGIHILAVDIGVGGSMVCLSWPTAERRARLTRRSHARWRSFYRQR